MADNQGIVRLVYESVRRFVRVAVPPDGTLLAWDELPSLHQRMLVSAAAGALADPAEAARVGIEARHTAQRLVDGWLGDHFDQRADAVVDLVDRIATELAWRQELLATLCTEQLRAATGSGGTTE